MKIIRLALLATAVLLFGCIRGCVSASAERTRTDRSLQLTPAGDVDWDWLGWHPPMLPPAGRSLFDPARPASSLKYQETTTRTRGDYHELRGDGLKAAVSLVTDGISGIADSVPGGWTTIGALVGGPTGIGAALIGWLMHARGKAKENAKQADLERMRAEAIEEKHRAKDEAFDEADRRGMLLYAHPPPAAPGPGGAS